MRAWLIGVLLACGSAGCSSMEMSSGVTGNADFGATVGGVKDMSFARGLVEAGSVPPPEAFLPEALFAEHDLPVEGSPCAELLCTRAVMGVAPNETGAMAAFAQVGLSSTVDPATYVRPSLAIVATVDISGSMQWSYGDGQGTAPAAIAQTLLHNLAQRLGGGDRIALVTYGTDVTTELDWTDGDDPEVLEAVGTLAEGGSTNMEAGLERAYELAEEALGSAEEVRVLLFTDAQPNVGATGASAFESIVDAGAADGIGITVFGLGLGLGADLMGHMAVLRGANAFSLDHADDVALFVEDNWPWLAAPIAYDLHVALSPRADLSLHRTFGFPAAGPAATEAKVDAASVFLSKNRGALLAELLPAAPAELAGAEVGLTLSYVDRGGTPHASELTASYAGQPLDERGAFMPQVGIDKTVALALLADGLRTAATEYGTDHAQAIATLEAALARFATDAAHIGAADLDAEAAFWPQLLQLMQNGAPQGDLYGQGSY